MLHSKSEFEFRKEVDFFERVIFECRKLLEMEIYPARREKVENVYFKALKFVSQKNHDFQCNLHEPMKFLESSNDCKNSKYLLDDRQALEQKKIKTPNKLDASFRNKEIDIRNEILFQSMIDNRCLPETQKDVKNLHWLDNSNKESFKSPFNSNEISRNSLSLNNKSKVGNYSRNEFQQREEIPLITYQPDIKSIGPERIDLHNSINHLKKLQTKWKQLDAIRQNIRKELMNLSTNMTERNQVNKHYFNTLDELNQCNIQMNAYILYLMQKYGDIRKNENQLKDDKRISFNIEESSKNYEHGDLPYHKRISFNIEERSKSSAHGELPYGDKNISFNIEETSQNYEHSKYEHDLPYDKILNKNNFLRKETIEENNDPGIKKQNIDNLSSNFTKFVSKEISTRQKNGNEMVKHKTETKKAKRHGTADDTDSFEENELLLSNNEQKFNKFHQQQSTYGRTKTKSKFKNYSLHDSGFSGSTNKLLNKSFVNTPEESIRNIRGYNHQPTPQKHKETFCEYQNDVVVGKNISFTKEPKVEKKLPILKEKSANASIKIPEGINHTENVDQFSSRQLHINRRNTIKTDYVPLHGNNHDFHLMEPSNQMFNSDIRNDSKTFAYEFTPSLQHDSMALMKRSTNESQKSVRIKTDEDLTSYRRKSDLRRHIDHENYTANEIYPILRKLKPDFNAKVNSNNKLNRQLIYSRNVPYQQVQETYGPLERNVASNVKARRYPLETFQTKYIAKSSRERESNNRPTHVKYSGINSIGDLRTNGRTNIELLHKTDLQTQPRSSLTDTLGKNYINSESVFSVCTNQPDNYQEKLSDEGNKLYNQAEHVTKSRIDFDSDQSIDYVKRNTNEDFCREVHRERYPISKQMETTMQTSTKKHDDKSTQMKTKYDKNDLTRMNGTVLNYTSSSKDLQQFSTKGTVISPRKLCYDNEESISPDNTIEYVPYESHNDIQKRLNYNTRKELEIPVIGIVNTSQQTKNILHEPQQKNERIHNTLDHTLQQQNQEGPKGNVKSDSTLEHSSTSTLYNKLQKKLLQKKNTEKEELHHSNETVIKHEQFQHNSSSHAKNFRLNKNETYIKDVNILEQTKSIANKQQRNEKIGRVNNYRLLDRTSQQINQEKPIVREQSNFTLGHNCTAASYNKLQETNLQKPLENLRKEELHDVVNEIVINHEQSHLNSLSHENNLRFDKDETCIEDVNISEQTKIKLIKPQQNEMMSGGSNYQSLDQTLQQQYQEKPIDLEQSNSTLEHKPIATSYNNLRETNFQEEISKAEELLDLPREIVTNYEQFTLNSLSQQNNFDRFDKEETYIKDVNILEQAKSIINEPQQQHEKIDLVSYSDALDLTLQQQHQEKPIAIEQSNPSLEHNPIATSYNELREANLQKPLAISKKEELHDISNELVINYEQFQLNSLSYENNFRSDKEKICIKDANISMQKTEHSKQQHNERIPGDSSYRSSDQSSQPQHQEKLISNVNIDSTLEHISLDTSNNKLHENISQKPQVTSKKEELHNFSNGAVINYEQFQLNLLFQENNFNFNKNESCSEDRNQKIIISLEPVYAAKVNSTIYAESNADSNDYLFLPHFLTFENDEFLQIKHIDPECTTPKTIINSSNNPEEVLEIRLHPTETVRLNIDIHDQEDGKKDEDIQFLLTEPNALMTLQMEHSLQHRNDNVTKSLTLDPFQTDGFTFQTKQNISRLEESCEALDVQNLNTKTSNLCNSTNDHKVEEFAINLDDNVEFCEEDSDKFDQLRDPVSIPFHSAEKHKNDKVPTDYIKLMQYQVDAKLNYFDEDNDQFRQNINTNMKLYKINGSNNNNNNINNTINNIDSTESIRESAADEWHIPSGIIQFIGNSEPDSLSYSNVADSPNNECSYSENNKEHYGRETLDINGNFKPPELEIDVEKDFSTCYNEKHFESTKPVLETADNTNQDEDCDEVSTDTNILPFNENFTTYIGQSQKHLYDFNSAQGNGKTSADAFLISSKAIRDIVNKEDSNLVISENKEPFGISCLNVISNDNEESIKLEKFPEQFEQNIIETDANVVTSVEHDPSTMQPVEDFRDGVAVNATDINLQCLVEKTDKLLHDKDTNITLSEGNKVHIKDHLKDTPLAETIIETVTETYETPSLAMKSIEHIEHKNLFSSEVLSDKNKDNKPDYSENSTEQSIQRILDDPGESTNEIESLTTIESDSDISVSTDILNTIASTKNEVSPCNVPNVPKDTKNNGPCMTLVDKGIQTLFVNDNNHDNTEAVCDYTVNSNRTNVISDQTTLGSTSKKENKQETFTVDALEKQAKAIQTLSYKMKSTSVQTTADSDQNYDRHYTDSPKVLCDESIQSDILESDSCEEKTILKHTQITQVELKDNFDITSEQKRVSSISSSLKELNTSFHDLLSLTRDRNSNDILTESEKSLQQSSYILLNLYANEISKQAVSIAMTEVNVFFRIRFETTHTSDASIYLNNKAAEITTTISFETGNYERCLSNETKYLNQLCDKVHREEVQKQNSTSTDSLSDKSYNSNKLPGQEDSWDTTESEEINSEKILYSARFNYLTVNGYENSDKEDSVYSGYASTLEWDEYIENTKTNKLSNDEELETETHIENNHSNDKFCALNDSGFVSAQILDSYDDKYSCEEPSIEQYEVQNDYQEPGNITNSNNSNNEAALVTDIHPVQTLVSNEDICHSDVLYTDLDLEKEEYNDQNEKNQKDGSMLSLNSVETESWEASLPNIASPPTENKLGRFNDEETVNFLQEPQSIGLEEYTGYETNVKISKNNSKYIKGNEFVILTLDVQEASQENQANDNRKEFQQQVCENGMQNNEGGVSNLSAIDDNEKMIESDSKFVTDKAKLPKLGNTSQQNHGYKTTKDYSDITDVKQLHLAENLKQTHEDSHNANERSSLADGVEMFSFDEVTDDLLNASNGLQYEKVRSDSLSGFENFQFPIDGLHDDVPSYSNYQSRNCHELKGDFDLIFGEQRMLDTGDRPDENQNVPVQQSALWRSFENNQEKRVDQSKSFKNTANQWESFEDNLDRQLSQLSKRKKEINKTPDIQSENTDSERFASCLLCNSKDATMCSHASDIDLVCSDNTSIAKDVFDDCFVDSNCESTISSINESTKPSSQICLNHQDEKYSDKSKRELNTKENMGQFDNANIINNELSRDMKSTNNDNDLNSSIPSNFSSSRIIKNTSTTDDPTYASESKISSKDVIGLKSGDPEYGEQLKGNNNEDIEYHGNNSKDTETCAHSSNIDIVHPDNTSIGNDAFDDCFVVSNCESNISAITESIKHSSEICSDHPDENDSDNSIRELRINGNIDQVDSGKNDDHRLRMDMKSTKNDNDLNGRISCSSSFSSNFENDMSATDDLTGASEYKRCFEEIIDCNDCLSDQKMESSDPESGEHFEGSKSKDTEYHDDKCNQDTINRHERLKRFSSHILDQHISCRFCHARNCKNNTSSTDTPILANESKYCFEEVIDCRDCSSDQKIELRDRECGEPFESTKSEDTEYRDDKCDQDTINSHYRLKRCPSHILDQHISCRFCHARNCENNISSNDGSTCVSESKNCFQEVIDCQDCLLDEKYQSHDPQGGQAFEGDNSKDMEYLDENCNEDTINIHDKLKRCPSHILDRHISCRFCRARRDGTCANEADEMFWSNLKFNIGSTVTKTFKTKDLHTDNVYSQTNQEIKIRTNKKDYTDNENYNSFSIVENLASPGSITIVKIEEMEDTPSTLGDFVNTQKEDKNIIHESSSVIHSPEKTDIKCLIKENKNEFHDNPEMEHENEIVNLTNLTHYIETDNMGDFTKRRTSGEGLKEYKTMFHVPFPPKYKFIEKDIYLENIDDDFDDEVLFDNKLLTKCKTQIHDEDKRISSDDEIMEAVKEKRNVNTDLELYTTNKSSIELNGTYDENKKYPYINDEQLIDILYYQNEESTNEDQAKDTHFNTYESHLFPGTEEDTLKNAILAKYENSCAVSENNLFIAPEAVTIDSNDEIKIANAKRFDNDAGKFENIIHDSTDTCMEESDIQVSDLESDLVVQENYSHAKNNNYIVESDNSVQEKDNPVKKRNIPVLENNIFVQENDKSVLEREMQVQGRDNSMQEHNIFVDEIDIPGIEEDNSIKVKDIYMQEDNMFAQENGNSVLEKDISVQGRNAKILSSDDEIVEAVKEVENIKIDLDLHASNKSITELTGTCDENKKYPNINDEQLIDMPYHQNEESSIAKYEDQTTDTDITTYEPQLIAATEENTLKNAILAKYEQPHTISEDNLFIVTEAVTIDRNDEIKIANTNSYEDETGKFVDIIYDITDSSMENSDISVSVVESDLVVRERDRSIQEHDIFVQENDNSVLEKDIPVQDRDIYKQEINTIVQENDTSFLERDIQVQGRDISMQEHNIFTEESDIPVKEDISMQEDNIFDKVNDSSVLEKEIQVQGTNIFVQESDITVKEKDIFVQEMGMSASETPSPVPDNEISIKKIDATVLKSTSPQEKDITDQGSVKMCVNLTTVSVSEAFNSVQERDINFLESDIFVQGVYSSAKANTPQSFICGQKNEIPAKESDISIHESDISGRDSVKEKNPTYVEEVSISTHSNGISHQEWDNEHLFRIKDYSEYETHMIDEITSINTIQKKIIEKSSLGEENEAARINTDSSLEIQEERINAESNKTDEVSNQYNIEHLVDTQHLSKHGEQEQIKTDQTEKTTRCSTPYQFNTYDSNTSFIEDFNNVIIIDNGSSTIKAGLATDDVPMTMPSIIGTANYQKVFPTQQEQQYWIGDEAIDYRGMLRLKYPIQRGILQDWDAMEMLWDRIFNVHLRIDPEDCPIFQTEPPNNPKQNRERTLEIMFETYNTPAYYTCIQGVLALYECGRTTGIVLDSGDGVTKVLPVYEGYGLPHASQTLNLGGRDITTYLQQILSEKGTNLRTSAEFEILREIKEKKCFLTTEPTDFESGNFSQYDTTYQLPDGQIISMDSEIIRCPEILFQPSLIGCEQPGVHQMLYKSIQETDIDLRSELSRNIILAGGSALFHNFDKRLEKELHHLQPIRKRNAIKIHTGNNALFSIWKGASILSSISTFKDMLISKDEYNDYGRNIVHMKCI